MSTPLTVINYQGDVRYFPGWLAADTAARLFDQLRDETLWQQERITVYGRTLPAPRLTAWYADPGIGYRYSGVEHRPQPWTPALAWLRRRLEQLTVDGQPPLRFNSVLLNRYRDGNDSVGWHSDAEPELGLNPVIASLSLGASRRFLLRHKTCNTARAAVELHRGDLLLMLGQTQHRWRHSLPKSRKTVAVGERINLTFRYVQS